MASGTSSYEIIGDFKVDKIIAGFKRAQEAKKEFERPLKGGYAEDATRRFKSNFDQIYSGFNKMRSTYREVKNIWDEQFHSLEKYQHAAMKVAAAQQRLFALNLGPEDNNKALEGINKIVKNLKGMEVSEVTDTFLDLHSALGSVDHALELLSSASKYKFNMQTLFGEKFSSQQIDSQILGAFKFLEQTGIMRATGPAGASGKRLFTGEDKQRAEEYFNVISKITAATAGRITGQELMQLSGRGGMSLMGLSPEGLKNLVFIMQEMGGSATGTALSSAFQKFVGGSMKQSSMVELEKLGLLDKSKVEFNKSGLPKHIQPGAVPIARLLQEDPLAFADALAKAMKEKKGIDPNNIKAVTDELSNIVGGQGKTTGNLLAKLIIMRDVIRKDAEIVNNAKGNNEEYAQSVEAIAGKIKILQAARENFRAAMGQGLLGIEGEAMRNFLPLIKSLSDFFLLHPHVAQMAGAMLLFGKASSGVFQTLATMRLAGYLGGNGAFAQTSREIDQAAGKAAWYKRSLSGIPAAIGTTIVLTLATEVLAYIWQLKKDADEAWENAKGVSKATSNKIQQTYETVDADKIKQLTRAQMPTSIAAFVTGFTARNKGLGDYLAYGLENYSGLGLLLQSAGLNNPLAGSLKTTMKGSPNQLQSDIKQYMPELALPSQFAMFTEALAKSPMPKDDKQAVMNAAMSAFPEAFKKYDEAMRQSAGDRNAAIQMLVAQDKDMTVALASAANNVKNFGDATQGIADKINALKLNQPDDADGDNKDKKGKKGKLVPGAASGARVLRSGFAYIHGGEEVIPAHLTKQLASTVAMRDSQANEIHIHAPITIHAAPGTDTAAIEKLLRQHAREIGEIARRELNDYHRDRALGN